MSGSTTPRSRLRFESIHRETTPDGFCLVTVRLEWDGHVHESTVTGLETAQGVLNAASRAALDSVLSAASALSLEMVGVKAVRAFDGWVVVTRVNSRGAGDVRRLLGAAPCEQEEELPSAAVMAVLDASNRVFGVAVTELADPTS